MDKTILNEEIEYNLDDFLNTKQQAYVVYYSDFIFEKFAKNLPLKITFNSKKLKAIFFYTDIKNEIRITETMKKFKGFLNIEKSPMFNFGLNF